MKNILICQHGGSGNHGCEALARTVVDLIRKAEPRARITLYSYSVPEDRRYLGDMGGLNIRGLNRLPGRYSLHNLQYHARRALGRQASKLPLTAEFRALVEQADLVVAIGGDNYCYNQGRGYWPLDRYIKSSGKPYILLGCSIEPDDLPRGLAEHLRLFDCITVRESISMDAMAAAGLQNIALVPDSAFLLEAEDTPLPPGFVPERAVGINLSPLVIQSEQTAGVTLGAFVHLARHILDSTDLQLALIPHVTWRSSDDRKALRALADALDDRSGRVFTLDDTPARAVKGIIGRLRFFVGARTHATIAAYSMGVPTLTLGYSVKARGIARDLFGQEAGYVVPVQGLSREDQLTEAFTALFEREAALRRHLSDTLPDYLARAGQAAEHIGRMLARSATRPVSSVPDRGSIAGFIGRERCCGCGACAAVCPADCIVMQPDREGFDQPHVDEAACTGCGACRKACPAALPAGEARPRAAFAACAQDAETLQSGSSGGLFALLARQALAEGAAVYGAAFDARFRLRHVRCEGADALGPLLGSKYVQSDSRAAIWAALRALEQGQRVLFSGTTCQVNAMALATSPALRDRLTLVDVVCHGTPSPRVLDKYRAELEAAAGAPLAALSFRDKVTGWQRFSLTATFENGARVSQPFTENPYMQLFLQNLSLRRSCYTCPSKGQPLADLTLADFWGIGHFVPEFDATGGASLVLVRTEKGQALLDSVSAGLRLSPTSLAGMERYNPCIFKPVPRPQGRDAFFANLDTMSMADLAGAYTKGPSLKARLKKAASGLVGR